MTGDYDDNELVVEHIMTLLDEPFVDYGYLKVAFSSEMRKIISSILRKFTA